MEEIRKRIELETPLKIRTWFRNSYEELKMERFPSNSKSDEEMKATQIGMYPKPVPCSEKPFDSLKRTSIDKLFLEVKNEGSYLLVRTIEPALYKECIQVLVEDHLGNVIFLQAFNFSDIDLDLSADEILPIGTVFALKEPFADKILNSRCFLRTDSSSDIIIIGRAHLLYDTICNINWINSIPRTDPIVEPTTGDGWKTRGNELFRKKKYTLAREAYLVALKYTNSPKTITLIHLNLSAVYLALGYFESCLESALQVIGDDQVNVKALFRAGRACYELRRFQEAKEYFEKLLTVDKTNLEAALQAERCIQRLKEANGNVNIQDLFTRASTHPKTLLDCADYTGPLEIVPIPGKGRGIVATSDIDQGTLLVVSKSVATVFKLGLFGGIALISKLMQEILKNPNTVGKAVYNLTTNHIERENLKNFCDETTRKEPIADTSRIRNIVSANYLGMASGLSLFIFPSFINHSCVPNANQNFYNDVVVIHALNSIRCGEEITISYHQIEPDYLIRKAKLMFRGFQCICFLCQLDDQLPISAMVKIGALMKESEILAGDKLTDLKTVSRKLMSFTEELENLYQSVDRKRMKIALMCLYYHLIMVLVREGSTSQALVLFKKALESVDMDSCELLKRSRKGGPNIFPEGSGAFAYCYIWRLIKVAAEIYYYSGLHKLAESWKKVATKIKRTADGRDHRR